MSFEDFLRAKRLRRHETSPEEIGHLLLRAQRDLEHARVSEDSQDWRFIAAYSAALSLCAIPVVASGYRASGPGHHVTIIKALPAAFGPEATKLMNYLDDCRELRNQVLYEKPGLIAVEEVDQLMSVVVRLRESVLAWLAEEHPSLLPDIGPDEQ
jgi:hypothetical protein